MKRIIFISLLFISLFASAQNTHTITYDQAVANQKGIGFSNYDLTQAFLNAHQGDRIGPVLGGFLEFDIIYDASTGYYILVSSDGEAGVFVRRSTTIAGLATATRTDLSSTFTNGTWPSVKFTNGAYYYSVTNRGVSPTRTDLYKCTSYNSGCSFVETMATNTADGSMWYDEIKNLWMLACNTQHDIYGNTTTPSQIYTSPTIDGTYTLANYIYKKQQRRDWHNQFEADPMVFTFAGQRYGLMAGDPADFPRGLGIFKIDSNYQAQELATTLALPRERWENANIGNPVFLADKDGTLKIFYNEFYNDNAVAGWYGLNYLQLRTSYANGVTDSLLFKFNPSEITNTKKSVSFFPYGYYQPTPDGGIQFYKSPAGINQQTRIDTMSAYTAILKVRVDSLPATVQRYMSWDQGQTTLTTTGVMGIFMDTCKRFAVNRQNGNVAPDNATFGLTDFGPVTTVGNIYNIVATHTDSVTTISINGQFAYAWKDTLSRTSQAIINIIKIGNDSSIYSGTASGKQPYFTLYRAEVHSDNLRQDATGSNDFTSLPVTWDADFLSYLTCIKNKGRSLPLPVMAADNNLVVDLKAASAWTKFNSILLHTQFDTATGNVNLKDTTKNAVTGALTNLPFDSKGIQWDNNNIHSYQNTQLNVNTLSISAGHLGYFNPVNGISGIQGGVVNGGNHLFFGIGFPLFRWGDTGGADITYSGTASGFYLLGVSSASRLVLWKDGVEVDSNLTTRSTMPTAGVNYYWGGNATSTPNQVSNGTNGYGSAFTLGGTSLNNDQAVAVGLAFKKWGLALGLYSRLADPNSASNKIIAGTNISTSSNIFSTTVSTGFLSGTATLDFGSTSAGTSTDLTMTVTGATVGQTVILGVPNASTLTNGTFTAWVSASNTITVRFTNTNLVSALDPASGSFTAKVIQ